MIQLCLAVVWLCVYCGLYRFLQSFSHSLSVGQLLWCSYGDRVRMTCVSEFSRCGGLNTCEGGCLLSLPLMQVSATAFRVALDLKPDMINAFRKYWRVELCCSLRLFAGELESHQRIGGAVRACAQWNCSSGCDPAPRNFPAS